MSNIAITIFVIIVLIVNIAIINTIRKSLKGEEIELYGVGRGSYKTKKSKMSKLEYANFFVANTILLILLNALMIWVLILKY